MPINEEIAYDAGIFVIPIVIDFLLSTNNDSAKSRHANDHGIIKKDKGKLYPSSGFKNTIAERKAATQRMIAVKIASMTMQCVLLILFINPIL